MNRDENVGTLSQDNRGVVRQSTVVPNALDHGLLIMNRFPRLSIFRFHTHLCVIACLLLFATARSPVAGATPSDDRNSADVVIYGGTSAGIAAAIQVKRLGRSVILLEPSGHLGGLTTGGLGQTDIGNKAAIGGVSREFYQRVRRYYSQESTWKWQTRGEYRSIGQSETSPDEDTMWTFEPHVALKIYQDWLAEMQIPVIMNERLDRRNGVQLTRAIPGTIRSWLLI